jgi:hypothetical protein
VPGPRLCTVYIGVSTGPRYGTNVSASTPREAARTALAFFRADFWKGPKPKPETILEISPMGIERRWRIRAADADRAELGVRNERTDSRA